MDLRDVLLLQLLASNFQNAASNHDKDTIYLDSDSYKTYTIDQVKQFCESRLKLLGYTYNSSNNESFFNQFEYARYFFNTKQNSIERGIAHCIFHGILENPMLKADSIGFKFVLSKLAQVTRESDDSVRPLIDIGYKITPSLSTYERKELMQQAYQIIRSNKQVEYHQLCTKIINDKKDQIFQFISMVFECSCIISTIEVKQKDIIKKTVDHRQNKQNGNEVNIFIIPSEDNTASFFFLKSKQQQQSNDNFGGFFQNAQPQKQVEKIVYVDKAPNFVDGIENKIIDISCKKCNSLNNVKIPKHMKKPDAFTCQYCKTLNQFQNDSSLQAGNDQEVQKLKLQIQTKDDEIQTQKQLILSLQKSNEELKKQQYNDITINMQQIIDSQEKQISELNNKLNLANQNYANLKQSMQQNQSSNSSPQKLQEKITQQDQQILLYKQEMEKLQKQLQQQKPQQQQQQMPLNQMSQVAQRQKPLLFSGQDICFDHSSIFGNGGFAQIYKTQIQGKTYAQKLFFDNIKEKNKKDIISHLSNFFKEIQNMMVVSELQSPYLLELRGVAMTINQDIFYLAFYTDMQKQNLAVFINNDEIVITIQEKLKILKQIAEVLVQFNKHNIIHGDLKPQNILLDEQNNVKISDFGTTKIAEFTYSQATGKDAFTPRYSPPELFDGQKNAWTDVWSFGCLVFEIISGYKPWNNVDNSDKIKTLCQTDNLIKHFKQYFPSEANSLNQKQQNLIELCTKQKPEDRIKPDKIIELLNNM